MSTLIASQDSVMTHLEYFIELSLSASLTLQDDERITWINSPSIVLAFRREELS